MKDSLRKTYTPKYPLGEYIRRWCSQRSIQQKEFAEAVGYGTYHGVFQLESVTLKRFFRIVDYMAENSGLPEEFYLYRLKAVLQNKYIWTKK